MPYTIVKQDDEFCVYRKDADEEPQGDTLGCHETKDEAVAQIGAIESEERRQAEGKAEESLDRQLTEIRSAFNVAFPPPSLVETSRELWVNEVYDEYVIVETGQMLYKVSYTVKGEDFEFAPRDEWIEVEQQWAEKAVKLTAETDDHFEFEGLAVPYIGPFEDDKDFDGEKFSAETDLCLDWFPDGRPFLYDHGFDDDIGLNVMGRQIKSWESDVGLWARVQVQKSNRYWQKIKEMVEKGKLFFSSGALSRFIDVNKEGNIMRWPWVELTGTTTPANPYAVTMPSAQKSYKSIGLDFTIPKTDEAKGGQESARAEAEGGDNEGANKTQGVTTEMEEAKLQEMIAETTAQAVVAAFKAQSDAAVAVKETAEAEVAEKAAFEAKVAEAVKVQLAEHLGPSKLEHDDGSPDPSGIKILSRYDMLDDQTIDLLAYLMGQSKHGWSEGLRNALKTRFEDRGYISLGMDERENERLGVKAISVMDVTDTSNWVPRVMRAELWRKVRLENKIVSLFENIDMPSDTYDIPTESTDPTIYLVTEATAGTPTLSTGITTSQSADTKLALTSSKFGGAVWFSGELAEANVFPLLPVIRDQLGRKLADAAEYIIVNGDSDAGATNVSVATPGSTDKVKADEGLRKMCLITSTSQKVDVGALTFDDFVAIRKLLGKYAVDSANLVWLTDVDTWLSPIVKIDEFLTVDKYGDKATVLTGEVGKILGAPLIVSENIYKTGTNGSIISGGTTGNLLCVPRSCWIVGWRRHPRFAVNYYDHIDSTRITVLARMGFGGFDETSNSTCVALGYNITV